MVSTDLEKYWVLKISLANINMKTNASLAQFNALVGYFNGKRTLQT